MSEGSSSQIPALPGPVTKAICACLPIASRCEARLVSRSWRIHAGEAVNTIVVDQQQLRKQVFADFTAHRVTQQLRKAAAAEATAAGAAQGQTAAAAAAVTLSDYLQQQAPTASSSSSAMGLRNRRGRRVVEARQQHRRAAAAAAAQQQRRLNELHILALSRRLAAAFPGAVNALVLLDVGGYGPSAAPYPADVARKLLLLLSQCKQMARLRLDITVIGGNKKPDEHDNVEQPQQQPQQQQQGAANAGLAGLLPLPAWVQQQPAVAAAMAAAQPGQNDPQQDDNDIETILGFNPEDSDYCYGWIARLLQHLQQQQQQGLQFESSANQASSSSIPAAVQLKRQLLQPVLVWKPSDLQQQQQPWSQDLLSTAASSSRSATPRGRNATPAAAAAAAAAVPLVLEVCFSGAAYPRDAADWHQLCGVSSAASLLLPEHRPAVLPGTVKQGLAGLTQLRALQLAVDAGYASATAARQWGVEQSQCSSSSLTALCQLTRLTHLALHTEGCSMSDITAAVINLTALRALCLSGNSLVFLPAVIPRLTQLQLLVLQQQVSLYELDLMSTSCPRLKYLEALGVIETAGAQQNLLPYQFLLPTTIATEFLAAAAAAAGTLLGPGADSLSQRNHRWVRAEVCNTFVVDSVIGTVTPAGTVVSPALTDVAATFYSELHGDAGRAAAEAAKLMRSFNSQMPPSSSSSGGKRMHHIQIVPPSCDSAAAAAGSTLQPVAEQQCSGSCVASVWWCQLLSAQDDLKQSVLAYTVNKLHMSDRVPRLLLAHSRDSTPAVSAVSLLQLATAAAQSAEQAAVTAGVMVQPGTLVLVREDHMPAGAVAELLDRLLCASPVVPPCDPTAEQQQHDLAVEQAALQWWKTQQHCNRTEQNVLTQQQGQAENNSAAAEQAGAAGAAEIDDEYEGAAAPAAAAQGPAPAPRIRHVDDMGVLLSQHVDWESYALHLQQWLQDRYSTGPQSNTTWNSNTTTTSSSSNSSRPLALKHIMLCVGDGGDMSVLCPSLPALEHLELAVPPCITAFKTAHTAPTDAATLPQLQLWMGHSRDLSVQRESTADTAAAAAGDSGGAGSRPSDEHDGEIDELSGGEVRTQAARAEDVATGTGCQQQQQQQWHDFLMKEHGSFSGSFLAQQRQAISLRTKAATPARPTTTTSSREQIKPRPTLVLPQPLLPPAPPSPSCYFAHLKTLTITNLSRHDVPWEPSASLGDAVVAAAALGCPALQCLELSGILTVTGGGLLLLRRCAQLKALRLEQWTNTISQLSSQQYPLPVCCLPHGLTSLILINVQPIAHIHPLAALGAALEAAGTGDEIAAAAQTEAVAAAWRGAAAVDVSAVTAAAKAVAAAAHDGTPPRRHQEDSMFLGLGIAGRRKASPAAAVAAEPAADMPDGGSRSRSRMLISSRNWFTPEALALLLLDTFFGSSSSAGDDMSVEQSLARLCCSCCRAAGCHYAYCSNSSSSSSKSPNCLTGIFSRLEDLSIVAHGPSFESHRSQQAAAAAAAAGLDLFLAAGLPHAKSLKSLHVTASGAFSSVPCPAALLYGVLSAFNLATSSGWATALAAAALRSGALDSNVTLLQRSRCLWTALTGGGSESGDDVVCGSLSSSCQWLSHLGGCPKLRDVHLDLPLMMPGQLATLVNAVSSSSSITSLSLHGLVINLYSTHTELLHTLAQLKPTTTNTLSAAAASADAAAGSIAAREASTLLTAPSPAAAAVARDTDIPPPSSNVRPNPLRRVDISLTKHTLLPPVGLSLSRTWAAVKAQRHAAATAGELALLQQLRGVLTTAQHHIIAAQGGGAVGVAAGLAVPGNAVDAVMNLAVQLVGVDDGDNQQQVLQLAQLLEQLAAGAGQPQQPQPEAAPQPLQPAAAADGAPQPAAAAAAAEPAVMNAEQQQQGGPLGLISSLLMAVDHQIHMIQYHGPAAAAPYIMTHAAAASSADKEFARVLQRVLVSRGVTDCSVRLHGSRVRHKAGAGPRGSHGEGGGTGCTAAAAAGLGHRNNAATDIDDSETSDCSDSQDAASSDGRDTVAENTSGVSHPRDTRVQFLAPDSLPELTATFWDLTCTTSIFDTFGSGFMVAFSACLRGISALGPRIQHANFPGARLAFQAWKIIRNAFIGTAVIMLLSSLAVVTYLGWDDGLGSGLFHGRLGQQQQQQHDDEGSSGDSDHLLSDDDDNSDDSEANKYWSAVSHTGSEHTSVQHNVTPAQHNAVNGGALDPSSHSSSSSDQDQDEQHDHAGQAADEVGLQEPAAPAQHQPPPPPPPPPAAAGFLDAIGAGELLIPGGNASLEYIEQAIHDLLNPDGELLSPEGVDESGGTSGVPPQVQVVGQLDSAASVNFMLGAVPVYTGILLVFAWLTYMLFRLAWVCMRSLLRALMQQLW